MCNRLTYQPRHLKPLRERPTIDAAEQEFENSGEVRVVDFLAADEGILVADTGRQRTHVSTNTLLDRVDERGVGQPVEQARCKSTQIAQVTVPALTLLLGPEQLDEDLRLATCKFIQRISLTLQVYQPDLVRTLGTAFNR